MANYINNKEFESLIQLYFVDKSKYQDDLFIMFDKLIDQLTKAYSFDIDKEEAKQECFLLILKVLKNFNKDNGAAFNYFTTIILNNFRLLYTKNKKYSEKMKNYREHILGPNSENIFSEDQSPNSANTDPL